MNPVICSMYVIYIYICIITNFCIVYTNLSCSDTCIYLRQQPYKVELLPSSAFPVVQCFTFVILQHFIIQCSVCILYSIKENYPLHLLQKKALRIIDNSHYIAHTEPICKIHRLLKIPDMFSIALWKFYHKLMNNKLPACFSTVKPRFPEIVKHYEIRNPVFHLPAIKHKFAENSLQYCLIKLINEEHNFGMMSDKVERTSFHSFKVFIKHSVLDTYKSTRDIVECKACAIINK